MQNEATDTKQRSGELETAPLTISESLHVTILTEAAVALRQDVRQCAPGLKILRGLVQRAIDHGVIDPRTNQTVKLEGTGVMGLAGASARIVAECDVLLEAARKLEELGVGCRCEACLARKASPPAVSP